MPSVTFVLSLLTFILLVIVTLLLRKQLVSIILSTLRRGSTQQIPRRTNERIASINEGVIEIEASKRILVVEDNNDSRDLLTKLMQMSGFEAVSASDGVRALELVAMQKPDIIITDIHMPRMDGIELIRRLKRDPKTTDIPLVAVTAYGFEAGREAITAGAATYVLKPFMFDKFLETVKLILAGSFSPPTQQDKAPHTDQVESVKNSIVLINERLAHRFRSDPEALRRIDPVTFEKVVAELFEDDGYEVVVTQPRADGGKDIYVYKKDPITNLMLLVECKRYTPPNKVTVETARQLYGVVQRDRANAGVIVTTSYFTKPAKEFASGVPYQLFLIDFDNLSNWLRKKHKSL